MENDERKPEIEKVEAEKVETEAEAGQDEKSELKIFGEKIKERRGALGLSQKELAEELGVSVMTVRRLEWGQQKPKLSTLLRLAEELDTAVEYLINRDVPVGMSPKVERNLIYTSPAGQRIEIPYTPEGFQDLSRLVETMEAQGVPPGAQKIQKNITTVSAPQVAHLRGVFHDLMIRHGVDAKKAWEIAQAFD